jgi:hypothetical protein
MPAPPGRGSGVSHLTLDSVSCPTTQMCVAVGQRFDADPYGAGRPLIEQLAGTRWRSVPSPVRDGVLDSVSCSTPRPASWPA